MDLQYYFCTEDFYWKPQEQPAALVWPAFTEYVKHPMIKDDYNNTWTASSWHSTIYRGITDLIMMFVHFLNDSISIFPMIELNG